MRLSELMKMRAVDSAGDVLDHVTDVRLEERDEGWVVTDLLVGRGGLAQRLGFMHGEVERPVLLARLMAWIERHARVVPWDQVSLQEAVVRVTARGDDLARPEGHR